MGVLYCENEYDSMHCLECQKGYGLTGDCGDNGCSKCVKCSSNCNACHENKCYQCKCGYYLNPLNNFQCTKENTDQLPDSKNFSYPPNYLEPDCNNEYFIKINFILLIAFLLLLKLH